MKSISELTDFYYSDLNPHLKELERQREAVKQKVVNMGIAVGAVCAVVLVMIYMITGALDDSIFFVGAAGFMIGTLLYKNITREYTGDFKFRIIKPLIGAIDEGLAYSPSASVAQGRFERSKIFTHSIDRYSGNDLVDGHIDAIPLQFSDIHAQYKTKDSKGHTSWHTIFQGLFIVAEFNKHFKGETIVLPDSAEQTFGSLVGGWLQSKNMSRDELVKMDDPEFEKAFVVYGTDQIEARYLLTHAMMKRLLDFKKKSGRKIFISFVGSHIHLAIDYDHDLFEPAVFKSLLDYKLAMEYIGTLKLAIGIVEELKLNQKLWSKT